MIRLLSLLFIIASTVGSMAYAATPAVQTWFSTQGAKVMYVPANTLPMLDIRVVFDAGSARDGDHPGLARLTNALLSEGAGDWDANTLATRIDQQGIRLSSGAYRDMAWVSIRTLTAEPARTIAIETLSTILSKPQFGKQAIEQIRQQMIVGLRQAAQSPSTVASEKLYQALYANHPYAHPISGTATSLAAITNKAIQQFHQQFYVAANAVVAIVGDVDRKSAEQLAEQVLARLPKGQAAPALAEPKPIVGQSIKQTFPSSQSHLNIGYLGISRHDPDYFPLYVGNHILGGGSLTSILGEAVRNQRGLSYSVYSYFSPMRATGPFILVAQTKNSQATEAMHVMQDVLQSYMTAGPTAEQLQAAKKHIIGGFPLSVSSNSKIVEYIAMMGFYALPLDWLDSLPNKVAAVTAKQIRSAFQRRIQPQQPIAMVVGGDTQSAAGNKSRF
jgi:zinc protease